MYAFALRNTTEKHIRGCVVKTLCPTLPRFQSKMAIVWDRSIGPETIVNTAKAAWAKYREASVTCDNKMPIKLKDKFYKTIVKPAMI